MCTAVVGGAVLPVNSSENAISVLASVSDNLICGDFEYVLNSNNTVVIKKYNGAGENVEIPDEIDGNTLVCIDWKAFKDCAELKSVVIPDTVTTINSSAFRDCKGLTSIELPQNLRYIGISAFSGCIGLTEINIPEGTETIGEGAFLKCTGLTSIKIPDSLNSIDDSAFSFCSGLKSIIIPKNINSIGNYAFYGCNDLTIYGEKDSYAEQYAKDNNINFSVLRLMNKSFINTEMIAGKPVILNAVAEGGTGGYTYALMYKKSTNTTWTKIGTKYGANNVGTFVPKSAVLYDIMINVKDSRGNIKSKTFTIDVKSPLKNNTIINSESIKLGEKVVLKGAASGGSKKYKYAFYYKKSRNSTWTEMKPAYTTKSAAFIPGSVLNYDIKSVVVDADGRSTEKLFTVKVLK